MQIDVAIFEDNKLIRDALVAILNGTHQYNCVGAFDNGKFWEEQLQRSKPDIVLMDIEMPGLDGIELTRLITQKFENIKVLIQTVFDDTGKIFHALCAGASGYILKTDPPHKYLEAITEVYNGGSFMNAGVARKTLSFFTNKNIMMMAPQSEKFNLTEREKEILQRLIESRSLRSIAESLFISLETVRTHVKHIYKKLHVANRTEAVMKAIQQGLV
ncbi:MAG: response regulator transcription factor [Chitinophagaceae bacterium]|jgi:DNA-binding NarL/FixJ family response regulator|nr:response regulator transcription factor [Chitinophagaceae bacterium]MBP6045851.1 response regulator transcription factor [Ferruginibacter sp.]MBK7088899.1 response regulator transcription factor [Chitinophagaceae bacterium]MBK7347913.1 response regulator transcription factor [Chitinophagaceae bacterium]MBK7734556.1 response regulator transcription factor [Chitinophagaceae bacterium]